MWVFNGNKTARISFGLKEGHILCKGGIRGCFGNKVASLFGGSEFTCIREFILDLQSKRIKNILSEVQLKIQNNCY